MGAGKPPFATDTLARLYLAQGHYRVARAMADELPEGASVRALLAREAAGRIRLLEGLMDGAKAREEGRMSFRDTLEHICRSVDGTLAASIMGYDGIEVETCEVPSAAEAVEVNLGSAMVEYSNVFGQFRQAAAQLEAGEASEFTLRTEKLVAVGRSLSPEYFVVMALAPGANAGKARYVLRVGAGKIAVEL